MDIILTQPAIYRIRGRVVDAATGKPPTSAGVSITPRQESGAAGSIIATATTSATVNYNNATGIFELRNVIPGSYWLRASSSTDLNEPINLNVAGTARTAMELLDSVLMNSSRYAQIQSKCRRGYRGRRADLTLDCPSRCVSGSKDRIVFGYRTRQVRVNLRPANAGGSSNAYQAISFNAEGTAILGSVSGEYRIQMGAPSPEMYLKEATFERIDVLNKPWEITSQSSGTLNIVFSNKAGQIEGSLVDAQSQPVRGSQVILIRIWAASPELYKTAPPPKRSLYAARNYSRRLPGLCLGSYRSQCLVRSRSPFSI